jgi:diguanylate cyclase (GGDEF)-like protein/PAS domain S-box-containing protein
VELRWALLGIAAAALAAQAAHAAFGFGGQTLAEANGLLISISMCAAALAALLAAASATAARPARMAISVGMALYALGEVHFFAAGGTLSSFPTTSDLLWLSLYPLVMIGALLVIRSEAPGRQLRVLLEGAIVAFTAAALCYAVLLQPVLHQATAAGDVLVGQLSYPLLDLAVLTILLVLGLGNRGVLRLNYLLMGLGVTVLLITDTTNLHQLARNTYAPGTLLDSGWPAAILLVALSLQFQSPLIRPRGLTGWGYYAVMSLSLLISTALLGIERAADQYVALIVLTALVPVLVLVRLLWSLAANKRLTEDNAKIVATAGAGILRLATDDRIVSVNPAAARMLGWGQEELVGRTGHATMHHKRVNGTPYPASDCPALHAIRSGQIQRVSDEVFWRKDGTSFPVDYTSSPLREAGQIVGAILVFDDVTRQRGLESRLRHLADHDALTGLFNRRRFDKEASEQVRQVARYHRPGALAIIDLDAFKFVNDSMGHATGDRLLCKVASILRERVRETDVIARLGGDEFALLLREVEPSEAVALVRRILADVKAATAPTLTASAGITFFDGAPRLSSDDLLISADLALYEAKRLGGARAVRSSGHKGHALTWVDRVREAIEKDHFVVYTQPIVDLKTGAVAREELLVRMQNEDGDIIPPASFLPTAERFNLIGEIDRLMVERGLSLAEQGRAVAINLSSDSLSDPEIIERVAAAVSAGLDPSLVSFEITETAATTNMAPAVQFAERLERLGCELALDDFGTGFGSFSYLHKLPVQVIKIDVEFVRDLPHNLSDYHLIRVLVSLAGSLGQETVAEGVEDAACVEVLRGLGVDYAQGYFFGRPREVEGGKLLQVEPEAQAALAAPLHV